MASEHTLYLVATPIGHLDDLSLRAVATLRRVDRIYAEDTRHSVGLLKAHGIDTPLFPLHEHNESERAEAVAREIRDGGDAALISDAGTPLISDPGYRLVNACIEQGVCVSPVPGACALIAALSASGLPTDRFAYAGFPPSRGAARTDWFASVASTDRTLVFYESPHRILDALEQLRQHCGPDRPLVLARELTKRFETILRGTTAQLEQRVLQDSNQQRGEFVVVLGAAVVEIDPERVSVSLEQLVTALAPHLPPKALSRVVAEFTGMPRRDAYSRVLSLRDRKA